MKPSDFYPYRSEAARDTCYAYLDAMAAREWPTPSESRLISTSWGPTFVRVNGPPDAPPLVLLHGATATSLMWIPNIRTLSAHFQTFAVDQIGDFGESRCTRPIQSFDDLTSWLDELIAGIAPGRRAHLLGMSYGGAIAAQLALRSPARLDRLILVAPGATVLKPPLVFWAHFSLFALFRRRGLRSFMSWVFADMARKDPSFIDRTVEEILLNIRSLERRKTPMPPVLTDADWGRLAVPTLFLVGEREVIYSAAQAVRRLHRVAPAVTTEILDDVGHDLTIAQPEVVNARVIEFLHSGSASPAAAQTAAQSSA